MTEIHHMASSHPITPPPELVGQWTTEYIKTKPNCLGTEFIANRAAQWGANQELEACCEWVSKWVPYLDDFSIPEDKLRAARRPKPPSLKEQALEVLRQLENGEIAIGERANTIRRALEQIND